MAEAQPNVAGEETRTKSNASPGPSAEPRSFDQARSQAEKVGAAMANAPADIAQAAQPIIEGGRQMAEQSRRAGRQVADAWRQAVDPLLAMQYDMSQWFDDMFRQTFGFRGAPAPFRPMGRLSAASLFGMPPADMRETETAHLLAIELPGLSRDDVDLSISGDTLVVCGHKSEETDDASASYRVSERRYGRFERVFPLPPDVDRERIEAQFRNGLLKIALPKNPAAAPPREKIEIKG
jgi:HSP20 family protein